MGLLVSIGPQGRPLGKAPADLLHNRLLQIHVVQLGETLVTVTAMTVFLSVVPIVQVVDDTVAACVVGGIVSGAGIGIILRMASSGGGLDVVGVLLTKWRRDFSVGKVYLIVNLSLYIICLADPRTAP